jgi:hypothetical protein
VTRAVVFGGYGTFGSLVARELARLGTPVVVAGRDLARAEALARELGPLHRACHADVRDMGSCCSTLQGSLVAVNCAGPFGSLDDTLLRACLRLNCHYVDIGDDRAYAARVREHGGQFAAHGLAAVYGCSSLPAISGALAVRLQQGVAGGRDVSPERARVTLFIGNNNPKGVAAVRSLVAGLGRPIAAPQGTLYGFRHREVVMLPPPFGRRSVFNFESPDYDLLPAQVGARAVAVKVGFELRLATYGFAALAWLGLDYGERTARRLSWLGNRLGRFGSSGGAVMTELFYPGGAVRRAALVAREGGQRMAALPCALAAHALASGACKESGALAGHDLLGAAELLQRLTEAGHELHVPPSA